MNTYHIQRRVRPYPTVSGGKRVVGNLDWHEAPQAHEAYTSVEAAIGYIRELHRRGETTGYEWRVADTRGNTWTQNVHLWGRVPFKVTYSVRRVRSDGGLVRIGVSGKTLEEAKDYVRERLNAGSGREFRIVEVKEELVDYTPPPRDFALSPYVKRDDNDNLVTARWRREGNNVVIKLACGDEVTIAMTGFYGTWQGTRG